MKKDVFVALIIGFAIGAGIAVLAVRLPVILENSKKTEKVAEIENPTPKVVVENNTSINITEPIDQSILDKPDINVKGTVSPPASLVIETPLDSIIVVSDKEGFFSAQLKLTEGGNPIYITSLNQKSITETKTLNLFYTSENL